MAASDDNRIISSCLKGEVDSFEAIVRKYQTGILSMAWSILGNGEDAKDVAQETFFRAFRNLRSFDHTRDFRTWLHAIAYHTCLDQIKKKKTEKRHRSEIITLVPQRSEKAEPDLGIEESEIVKPLWMQLSIKERLALSLALNEGYTAAEIGAVLDCSENCARVHICHAKSKLRRWLMERHDVQNP